MHDKRTLIANLLVVAAIGLLAAIYYAPVWWVSLTAPNYPPEAFPDGVRIHFHMNGVFNGCKKIEKTEIVEEEALDCVHEMDTINHYVGMYPIAAGGVIEKAFSPFLLSMLAVMLLGFMFTSPLWRSIVLAAGFAAVVAWMSLAWHADGGLQYQGAGYLGGLVTALDQDTSAEEEDLSPGNAIIERLRQSLEQSGIRSEQPAAAEAAAQDEKTRNLEHLRATFDKDQERRPAAERQAWDGSTRQMMAWHYGKNLARYFNVPEQIKPMVAKMSLVADIVFWLIIGAMALLIAITRNNGSLFYWLLVVPAILLPVFFIIDYSGWLWWYGHTLNDMGAFTVKPFMPTVFGDGKVAQFTTHSYPYTGFGLMVASSVLLIIAANLRYKQFRGL